MTKVIRKWWYVQAVCAAISVFCLFSQNAVAGPSYTNWPKHSNWVNLTNHLDSVYSALTQRVDVAGISYTVPEPSYIYPLQDYINFAETIDDICIHFVVHTNADGQGSFNAYFAATETNDFPVWDSTNLHLAAGFDEWATNNVLNSWIVADHAIQQQVVDTLNLLKWISASYSTDTSYAHRGLWSGEGAQWGTNTTERSDDNNLYTVGGLDDSWAKVTGGGLPYAIINSADEPTGLSGLIGETTNVSGKTEYDIGDWTSISGDRSGWTYLLSVKLSATDFGFDPHNVDEANVYIPYPWDDDTVSRDIGDTTTSNWTSRVYMISAPYDSSATFSLFSDVAEPSGAILEIEELSYSGAYIDAKRNSQNIKVTGLPTSFESVRDLYALGEEYGGGFSITNFLWDDEGLGFGTSSYARVDSITNDSSASTSSVFSATNIPFYGTTEVYQVGWKVKGLKWLIRLDSHDGLIVPTNYISPTNIAQVRDTDRDGVIDLGVELRGRGVDTGTIVHDPWFEHPQLYLPLHQAPSWYQGLDVKAYLSQGAVTNLPFEFYYPFASGQEVLVRTNDAMGPFVVCNILSRIVEVGVDTNASPNIKRVSMIRPRGSFVVFDFPWESTNFSRYGYAQHPNEFRTYVLEDMTPATKSDAVFDLRFESGVIHSYRTNVSSVGVSVLDSIATPNGKTHDLSPADWDWFPSFLPGWFGYDLPPNGELAVVAGVPGGSIGATSDLRYDTELGVKTGHIGLTPTSITYEASAPGGGDIRTSFTVDETTGMITGLAKSGSDGYELSNASISGDVITYAWGTVTKSISGPPNQPLTTLVYYDSDSGTSWTEEFALNEKQQLRKERLTISSGARIKTSETEYIYNTGSNDRYDNELPKWSRLKEIKYPDKSWVSFDYKTDTGWLSEVERPDRGSTSKTEYDYSTLGSGDAADDDAFTERPRTVTEKFGGTTVAKTMYSYDSDSETIIQRATSAAHGWGHASNFKQTNEYITTLGLSYGALDKIYTPTATSDWSYAGSTSLKTTYDSGIGKTNYTEISGFGVVREQRSGEDGITTVDLSRTVNNVGRTLITSNNLSTLYSEVLTYSLYGPKTIRTEMGDTDTYDYFSNGALEYHIRGVDSTRTDYKLGELGRATRQIVKNGVEQITTEQRQDVLGRFEMQKGLLGQINSIFNDGVSGTKETRTLPTAGAPQAVVQNYLGGGLKELSGDAVSGPIKKVHEIDGATGLLADKTVLTGSPAGSEGEHVTTMVDLLGRPARSRRSGNGGNDIIRTFDSKFRLETSSDEEGITSSRTYGSDQRPLDTGVDGTGDDDIGDSGDSRRTQETSFSGSGVEVVGSAYPDGTTEVETDRVKVDLAGDKVTTVVAGRTNVIERSAYTAGGIFSVTNSLADGRKTISSFTKGRLSEFKVQDSTNRIWLKEVYEYKPLGNLASVSNVSGVTSYDYDPEFRLESATLPGSLGTIEIQYFDNTVRPKTVKYTDGTVESFEYKDNGELTLSHGPASYHLGSERDAQGRLSGLKTLREDLEKDTDLGLDPYTGLADTKKLPGAVQVEDIQRRDNRQVSVVTDADSVTSTQEYAIDGLQTNVSSSHAGTPDIQYGWDRMMRLTSHAVSGGLSESWSLTTDGRMVTNSITDAAGHVPTSTVSYSYAEASGAETQLVLTVSGFVTNAVSTIDYTGGLTFDTISHGDIAVSYKYVPESMIVEEMTISLGGTKCPDQK